MTPFEHVTVLISIVLGVAVTQLLAHLHALVAARRRVRHYWLAWLWTLLLFVTTVAWWWGAFALRQGTRWNFFFVLLLLVSPVLLYLASAFVLPTIEPDQQVDLRVHYWQTHRWFFGVLGASVLIDAARRMVLGDAVDSVGVLSNLASAIGAGVLAVSKQERVHAVLAMACAVALGWFILEAALELRG
jgi:hypothetical protein